MRRTLKLHRETLTELSADDLAMVAGARADDAWSIDLCPTLPLLPCLTASLVTLFCP